MACSSQPAYQLCACRHVNIWLPSSCFGAAAQGPTKSLSTGSKAHAYGMGYAAALGLGSPSTPNPKPSGRSGCALRSLLQSLSCRSLVQPQACHTNSERLHLISGQRSHDLTTLLD